MKADDPNITWIDDPPLGLSGKCTCRCSLAGLTTTLKHLFSRKVTVSFPEQRPTVGNPLLYRGVHRLNKDDQGRVKCVACFLCATACPAHCIDIVGTESPWPDREKYPESFTIDELRCIYCGMCEEACPVDAIELTSFLDLTGRSREEMIFDKEKLLSVLRSDERLRADEIGRDYARRRCGSSSLSGSRSVIRSLKRYTVHPNALSSIHHCDRLGAHRRRPLAHAAARR